MGYPAAYRQRGGQAPQGVSRPGFQKGPEAKILKYIAPRPHPSGATPSDPRPGLSGATKLDRQREIARELFPRNPKNTALGGWSNADYKKAFYDKALGPRGLQPKNIVTQIFGKRERLARRAQAWSFFKGGFRIRSVIFRWLMREVSHRAIELVRRKYLGNPAQAKHPLWNINGRWGLFPYCSGQTGQHLIGSSPIHNFAQTQFGHPWSVGFPWPEYDSVIKPTVGTWQFTVVGLGTQGLGPLPNTFYTELLKQKVNPWIENAPHTEQNPWHDRGYNPWWNKFHWPEPIPRVRPWHEPMPMWDPEGAPILSPWVQPTPKPLPWPLLPERRENPFRAPGQRSSWGPKAEADRDPMWDKIRMPRRKHKKRFRDEPDVTEIDWGGTKWRSLSWRGEKPGPFRKSPPKKRVKELKQKYLGFRHGLFYRFLNQLTEYQDLVDALYKSLPKNFRFKGKAKFDDKLRALYLNADQIVAKVAFEMVIKNELQDLIFGLMGRASAKTARKIGSPVDLNQRAFRKGQQQTRDAVNELVDAIYDFVFKGKSVSGYDPYWLHHGGT